MPRITAIITPALAVSLIVTSPAVATDTFLVSSFDTLFRLGPGLPTESFTLTPYLRALYRDPATGLAYAVQDSGGAATFATIYRINNPESGTPSLSQFAVLQHRYGTI